VIALDIESAKQQTLLHADGAVREITPTADSRFIAVTTNDGMLYTTKLPDNAKLLDAPWTWTTSAVSARHIEWTADDLLIVASTGGILWLYSAQLQRWLCLPVGTVNLGHTAINSRGNAAVALDTEGHLMWIDLDSARKQLASSVRRQQLQH
jgi:hypothetical protein